MSKNLPFAYLAAQGLHNPSEGLVQHTKCQLGLCGPLIFQYFKYLSSMFSLLPPTVISTIIPVLSTDTNLISVSVVRGMPVPDLLRSAVPLTIDLILGPLIIGIIFGVYIGFKSSKNRAIWKGKAIQILAAFGISIPVFSFGMMAQYSLGYVPFELGGVRLFDPTGYKSVVYSDPQPITGFFLIDSILSGQWHLVGDYLWHLFLPVFILTFVTISIITWQVHSYMANESKKKSIISITALTGRIFGLFIMSYILIEVIFDIPGMGSLLIDALFLYDYYVLSSILFIILILFVFVSFISNLIFILYNFSVNKGYFNRFIKPEDSSEREVENTSDEIHSEESIKVYLVKRLKSPLGIVGAILVFFFILISIFPQIITSYPREEVFLLHAGSWDPPSPAHPLGQTWIGGDVLGLIMWGLQDTMIFGFQAVLIGLIGGIILNTFTTRLWAIRDSSFAFKRGVYYIIKGLMLIFYIFPGILLLLLSIQIGGGENWIILYVIGILLIPGFTKVIANTMSRGINIRKIVKALICHIPLSFAIVIGLYTVVGFFTGFNILNLGTHVNRSRANPYEAPWASLFPGLAIFGIVFSFLLLHIGLQDHGPKNREFTNLIEVKMN
ncbi:MAG: hypothetical protein ACXAAH_08100 [Promethearchaeota archaeon]|jgi:peptide/nickel transport system permease protein